MYVPGWGGSSERVCLCAGLFTPFNPFESTQTAKLVACVNTLIIQLPQTEIESVRPTPEHPCQPSHPVSPPPGSPWQYLPLVALLGFGSHKQHTAEEIKSENRSHRKGEKVIQENTAKATSTRSRETKQSKTAELSGGHDTCDSDFWG